MNETIKRKSAYRLFAISMLVSIATIASMLVMVPASASNRDAADPKPGQGEKERASAQAKKDVNLCQELQPCVGDKLVSIDSTLHDISALVATMAFADPLPLGTFKNKNNECRRDTHNAFYDNTYPGAAAEKVTFYIKNSGSCPVEISVSGAQGGAAVGATHDIPPNNNNGQGARTGFNVPAGMYLRAKCKDTGTCNYVINEVRP
jgi:hypothetical protein